MHAWVLKQKKKKTYALHVLMISMFIYRTLCTAEVNFGLFAVLIIYIIDLRPGLGHWGD